MSCGNPHETPCTEVLDRVYGYLDGELADLDCAKIRQHLDECGPCLREYGLEEAVKRVVQKHCGCDPAPAELRAKILVRIREVRASIEFDKWIVEQFGLESPEDKAAGDEEA